MRILSQATYRVLLGLLATALIGFVDVRAAILIDNFSSATNDRFQNADSPDQFFLSGFELSGVGLSSNGGWGTLIGPNTILSANHFHPDSSVTFFADNDPLSTPITLTLSGDSQRINGTDLWLARLTTFAPASLQIYDYATTPISSPTSPYLLSPYRNKLVYMTGRSPTGGFQVAQSQAYGTNRTSGFVENNTDAGLGSVDALELRYNPGVTNYEAFFQGGDSGAPLFYDDGGQLIVLGVNSYISTVGGNPFASFSSYTGNEAATINAFVASAAAVPEPNAVILIAIALVGLTRAFRRSNCT